MFTKRASVSSTSSHGSRRSSLKSLRSSRRKSLSTSSNGSAKTSSSTKGNCPKTKITVQSRKIFESALKAYKDKQFQEQNSIVEDHLEDLKNSKNSSSRANSKSVTAQNQNGSNSAVDLENIPSIVVFDGVEYTSKYRTSGKKHYICHYCFYEIIGDQEKYNNHLAKCLSRHNDSFIVDSENTKLAYKSEENNRYLFANLTPNKLFACRLCHFARFFVGTKTANDAYADKFEYFMLYNKNREFVGY